MPRCTPQSDQPIFTWYNNYQLHYSRRDYGLTEWWRVYKTFAIIRIAVVTAINTKGPTRHRCDNQVRTKSWRLHSLGTQWQHLVFFRCGWILHQRCGWILHQRSRSSAQRAITQLLSYLIVRWGQQSLSLANVGDDRDTLSGNYHSSFSRHILLICSDTFLVEKFGKKFGSATREVDISRNIKIGIRQNSS